MKGNKGKNTNAKLKSIAIVLAVVAGLIAVTFAFAKYVFNQKDQTELNFFEYRIQPQEITLSTENYTGEGVTVTITPAILEQANQGKQDADKVTIQYKLGDDANAPWVDYTGPFNMSENQTIHARLVSDTDNFTGPVTDKKVTNIAVAKIGSTTYKTLAEAITAWTHLTDGEKQNAKIEMLADTSENVTIPQGENVKLDLCGFNVNGKTAATPVITVNGGLNLIDTGKTEQGSTTYGSVTSTNSTAVSVTSTGTLTLGTNESATSGNEEVVNTNGPVINGGTGSNGVVVAENGTLNFYDGKITAPSAANHTAIVVNNTPVGESNIDLVNTPNGYRLDISVDTESGREVATLVKTLTVSFDTNGGTPSDIADIEAAEGKAYGTYATWPTEPTKEGYTFKGWTIKNMFDENSILLSIPGATYENGHYVFSPSSARNLYGATGVGSSFRYIGSENLNLGFEEGKQYTLSIKGSTDLSNDGTHYETIYVGFVYNDGTSNLSDRIQISGENEVTRTVTSALGKTVDKIYISYGRSGKASIEYLKVEEGVEVTPYIITESTTVTKTENHTLTAIWNPITYTIVYNANTGSGSIDNTAAAYNVNVTLPDPSTNITKTGYTFKGWSTNQNANPDTDTLYTAGQQVSNLTTTNGDSITLYAIWKDETAPNNEAPTGTSTTNTITVNCNQTDEGSGIDTNTIQYSIYKDGAWTDWQDTPTFDNLQTNTDYQVKTRAKDNDGNGYTESQTATIKTQQIENATTTIHKDTATGEAVTPSSGMINNSTVVLTVDPATTGTTTVSVTDPNGTTTTYTLGTDVTIDPTDNTYHITVPNLTTGEYTITTSTTDGTNTASNTQTFEVDRTNPVIAETVTVTTNSVTVNANATDADSGIDTVTYTLKDENNQVVATNTTGVFTGLSDDHNYTVEITATDNAGNTTTKTVNTPTNELVAGSLTFKEASESTNFTPRTTAPASDAEKVWKNEDIDITIINGGIDDNGTIVVPSGVTTTYTVTTIPVEGEQSTSSAISQSPRTLETTNADYVVTVTTTDGTNTKTQTYYFSIDKTAPTVAISPMSADIDIPQTSNTANVTATLDITEDRSGIASVRYAISTDNQTAPSTGWTSAGAVSQASVAVTEGAGTYYIWTEATDNSGNVSTTVKTSGAFNVKYVVQFDMNIDTTQTEIITAETVKTTGSAVTLAPAQTRNGYLFKGWALDENAVAATHSAGASYTPTSSTTFYAVWSEVVASTTIGNNEPVLFDSVQAAIDYASTNEGAVVTLIKNEIEESVTVAAGQNIVLDTNGKTLTGENDAATITNLGTLTIQGNGNLVKTETSNPVIANSSILNIQGSTINGNSGEALTNSSAGTVSVSGGTIRNGGYQTNTIVNNGTMNVTAGQIRNTGSNSDATRAIENTGTLNISNNADIQSNGEGVSSSGIVSITGGNIYGRRYAVVNRYSGQINISGNTEITGGSTTAIVNSNTTTTNALITITGGTINATANAIDTTGNGKFIIGVDDGTVSTTSPVIVGNTRGIYRGHIEIYDGIFKGKTDAIYSGAVITATPEGYRIINGEDEIIDGETYHTAYLDNHWVVTYDYQGATSGNTDANKTVTYGENYGTLPAPEKTGYTFGGWKLNNNTITATSTVATAADHTLVAEWTANQYTLTFNANGGTVNPATKDVTYDDTYEELPTPTREGYTFAGWQDEQGNTYESTDTVNITENKTLIAGWTANSYTVTFNPNGGTVEPTSKSVTFDQAYGTLPTPNKTGYDFNGWKLNNNTITAESTVATTENHTLDADWTATTYTITYDNLNGGSYVTGTPQPSSYTIEDTVTLPTLEKTGYTFVGWKEVGAEDNTAITEISSGTTENKVLEAVFAPGTSGYTLTHYVEKANDTGYDQYSTSFVEATTDDVITLSTQAISIANATYERATDGAGNSVSTVTVAPDGTTEIKVYYTRDRYTLTVTAGTNTTNATGSGTYKVGQEVSISAEYGTRADFNYAEFAWTTTDTSILSSTTAMQAVVTMPAANTTVTSTAKKYATKYNITYDLGGGTAGQSAPTTVNYNEDVLINFPTREGYIFTGWTSSAADGLGSNATNYPNPWDGSLSISQIYKNLAEMPNGTEDEFYSVKLTANWRINGYRIIYDLDGGTAGENHPSIGTYGQNVGISWPTKEGFDFIGWTSSEEDGLGDEAHIYANHWDGSLSISQIFADLATIPVGDESEPYTVKLTAHWKYRYYNISYNLNGGTAGENAPTTANYNENVGISFPTKDGFEFAGWTSSVEDGLGSEAHIYANHWDGSLSTWQIIADLATIPVGGEATPYTVTLTAHWKYTYYNISYNLNGGTAGPNAPTTANYWQDVVISWPSKAGYSFMGWTSSVEDGLGSNATNYPNPWDGSLSISQIYKNLATLPTGFEESPYTVTMTAVFGDMEVSTNNVTIDLSDTSHLSKTVNIIGNNYGGATVASSDSNIATASVSGDTITITGVSNGTATIIVTSNDSVAGGSRFTRYITVNVITTPTAIEISPATSTIGVESGYNQTTLNATITPANANSQNNVTWASSNTSIATVDSTGTVTGLAEGTATITATTENGVTSSATVVVDATVPTVTTTITGGNTYAQSHTAQIQAVDSGIGLPQTQTISYGWSTSNSSASGITWETTTLSSATGIAEVTTPAGVTGTYYLWVKDGVKDAFDNATSANYINTTAVANLDNTKPVVAFDSSSTSSPSVASENSEITIPLKITEEHSGLYTAAEDSTKAFTADDIRVFVDGNEVTLTNAQKTITGGTKTGNDYKYTLTLTGVTGSGDLSIVVGSGTVEDKAGNTNAEATIATGVTMDSSSFTLSISAKDKATNEAVSTLTNADTLVYTFRFNKPTTDFTVSDISISGGSIDASTFTAVSSTEYTVEVNNTVTAVQTVSVPANSCEDAAGNKIGATNYSINIDKTAPEAPAVTVNTGNKTETAQSEETKTIYTGSVTNDLTFSAQDNTATVTSSVIGYKVSTTNDDWASQSVVSTAQGTATTAGTTYYIKSVDSAGNLSSETTTITLYLVTLSVSPATVSVENEHTTTLTATGDNTGTITWSSSDSTIASVAQDGTVTAHQVGTVTITATAANDTSVQATSTVTVTKGQVTPPTARTGLVYNGSAQTGVEAVANAKYTLSGNTETNAGTYTATATLTDPTNYEWSTGGTANKSIEWTIAPKPLTSQDIVAAISPTTYTYDGTAKTPTVTVVDGQTTLTENTDYEVAYTNNVNAGVETGTVTITATANGNYTGSVVEHFTINKTNMTVTVTNCSSIYDGQAHGIGLSIVPNSGTTVYYSTTVPLTSSNYSSAGSTTAPTLTNVGAETVYYYIVDSNGNYNDYSSNANSNNGTIIITPKQITPTITAQDKVYDGNTDAVGTVSVSGVISGDSVTPVVSAYSFENANTGTDKIVTATGISINNANYALSSTTATTTADITKAPLKAKYQGETIEFGETPELEQKIIVTGFVNGENESTAAGYVAPTLTPTPGTAQGTYTLTPTGGSADNYEFTEYEAGTLTITAKSNVTVELLDNGPFTYDGTAKTPGVRVKDGETVLTEGTDYTVDYEDNTDAGTATVVVTLINNYSGEKTKTFTIDKAQGTGTVAINDWTYGDLANSPTLTSSTNSSVTYRYTGTTNAEDPYSSATAPTQAGSYTVTATVAENSNYLGFTATDTFTINRKTLTVSATANNKVYDGTTDATGTITLTGAVNSETPTATATFAFDTASAGTGKTVNVTAITLDSAYTANYALNTTTTTSTADITKDQGTVTVTQADWTYGDSAVAPVISSTTNDASNPTILYEGTGSTTYASSSTAPTQAGTYKVTVTLPANENYEDVTVVENFEIEKRVLTVTAEANDKVYDGTTSATGSITLGNKIDGEDPIVTSTFTFANADAGNDKTVNVTVALTSEFTANYELDHASLTTTADITKDDITISKTDYTGTYDGNAHTFTLTTVPSSNVTIYYSTETPLTSSNFLAVGTTTKPTRTDAGTTTVYYYVHDTSGNYNSYASNAESNNATITINGKSLTATGITATLAENSVVYNGTNQTPAVTVTDGETTLVEGTDYEVSYSNNKNAGTANVTITGIGNYSDSIPKTFTITPKPITASVTVTTTTSDSHVGKVYDGTNTATGTISLTGVVSGDTVNATASGITYANATANANTSETKTVTASGITLSGAQSNNYTLSSTTATTSATIEKKTLTATYVSEAVDYGDSPALVINVTGFITGETDSGATMADGYVAPTISSVPTAVGSHTLTPEGGSATNYKFNYVSGTLTINASTNVEVTLSPTSYTYDGTAKTPTVTVTDKTTHEVVSASNYDVTYTNNTNAGTQAQVTVTLKGSYNGTVDKYFTINKADRTLTVTSPIYVGVGVTKNLATTGNETFTYTGETAKVTATSALDSTATATVTSGTPSVTGVAAGSTTVTISVAESTNYNSASTTANVTVTDFTISPVSTSTNEGGTVTITPTISPSGLSNEGKRISWSSSNTSVATISSATTTGTAITVTGVTDGTVTITATLNGQTKTAIVEVASNYAEYESGNDTPVRYYATLKDAFEKATSGNTIKPLKSLTDTSATNPTVASGKTLTFDLQNFTVTLNNTISNRGTLTIIGSGNGKVTSSTTTLDNRNICTLSAGVEINSSVADHTTIANYKTLTVNGARITSDNHRGINNAATAGTVTINSGSIYAKQTAIYNGSGTGNTTSNYAVKVNGGTIESTNNNTIYNNATGMIYLTGGTIKQENASSTINNAAGGIIQVSGATVEHKGSAGSAITSSGGSIIVTSGNVSTTGGVVSGKDDPNPNTDSRRRAISTSGSFTMSGGTVTSYYSEAVAVEGTNSSASVTGGTIQKGLDANSQSHSGPAFSYGGPLTATLSGGTIKTLSSGSATVYKGGTSGTIVLSGATVQNLGTGLAVHNAGAGTITINSGTIESNQNNTVFNAGTGTININNGNITSKDGNYNAVRNGPEDEDVTGTININNGTMTSTAGDGINNRSTGTINVYGGTITASSSKAAIVVTKGSVIMTGGTATGGSYGAYLSNTEENNPVFTLGTNDSTVTSSANSVPCVQGNSDWGVAVNKGTFNFYDGVVKGPNNKSISQNPDGLPTGYAVKKTPVTNNNVTTEVATLKKYNTITYDANSGTGAPSSVIKFKDESIQLSSTIPTRTGYTFTGWNTAANGSGTSYAAGATYSANADVTLYAQWTINKVRIRVNMNGGMLAAKHGSTFSTSGELVSNNSSTNIHTINYGASLGTNGLVDWSNENAMNITKPGYQALSGYEYNTRADGTGTSYNQNTQYAASDFADASSGDQVVTLYVNWTPRTYNITYTLNSGTASGNPSTYNIESSAITLNNPTRSGYTFEGWTEQVTGFTWAPGFVNNSTGALEMNTTYTDSYYTDFISVKAGETYTLSGYGDYAANDIRWRIYNADGTYSRNVNGDTCTMHSGEGYVRVSYYKTSTSEQRTGSIMTRSGKVSTMTIPTGSTGNRKYTANWMENNYAEYNGNKFVRYYATLSDALSSVTSGNTIKVLKNTTETTSAELAAGKTVTLDTNGKTITCSGFGEYQYTYSGNTSNVWSCIMNRGTMTITGTGTIVSAAEQLYGTILIYNQGTLNILNGTLIAPYSNSNLAILNDFQANGTDYTLLTIGANDGTVSTTQPVIKGYIFSTYTANNTKTTGFIKFYDGILSDRNDSLIYHFTHNTPPFIPENYSCFYEPNAEYGYYKVTLKRIYTITYDANGGTNAPENQNELDGTDITLSTSEPTREHYIFTGWNTAANGSGTSYAPGANYTVNADLTLYAQWVEANYEEYRNSKFIKGYITLQDALSGVASGNTIKPTKSLTDQSSANPELASGKSVTLDLQNYTVTLSKTIKNNGVLYVEGSGTGKLTSSVLTIDNRGALYINSGVEINGKSSSNPTIANYGRFGMYNGSVTSNNYRAITNDDENATIEVFGGTITAKQTAIYSNSAKAGSYLSSECAVYVDGGTIESTNNNTIYNNATGLIYISGGTVRQQNASSVINNAAGGSIEIAGGTVEHKASAGDAITSSGGNIIVSYGTVSTTGGVVAGEENPNADSNSRRRAISTSGTFEMSGGTVTSNYSEAVYVSGASATVSGGTIEKGLDANGTQQSGSAFQYSGTGTATLSRGIIKTLENCSSATVNKGATSGTLEINGATIQNLGTGYAVVNSSTTTPSTSKIIISSGNITANTSNAVRNTGVGTVEINGGKLTSTNGDAVHNASTGTITMSGGTVESKAGKAFAIADGNLTITGGTTKGVTHGVYLSTSNNPTFTLGVNDSTVTSSAYDNPSTNPSIEATGATGIGVAVNTGTFNFYDGVVIGANNKSISKFPNATPTNYGVHITKNSPSRGKDTATLIIANYAEYNGTTLVNNYSTLSDALFSVTNGNTIKAVFTETSRTENGAELASGKNATLDLNGKTLQMTRTLRNEGSLTVNGTGTLTGSNLNVVTNYGTYISNSVTYRSSVGMSLFLNEDNATATLLGGSLTSTDESTTIWNDGTMTIDSNITLTAASENYATVRNWGTLNINAATISRTNTQTEIEAVVNYAGNITVNGATITNKKGTGVLNKNNDTASGNLTVRTGTIKTDSGMGISNEGTVTLGISGSVSTTAPVIQGSSYGVYGIASSTLNFYGGKVIGENGKSILSNNLNTPSGYGIKTTTNSPSSGLETSVLGVKRTVTFDYNDTSNYATPAATLTKSSFNGGDNNTLIVATGTFDGMSAGEKLRITYDMSYTNLTAASGQTATVCSQGNCNPGGTWLSMGSSPKQTLSGSGTTSFDYTVDLTADKIEHNSFRIQLRFDYYASGSITASNIKITRIAKETKEVVNGTAVGTLPGATRAGYTLSGWYTTATGGSKISTATTISADKTYYAHWTASANSTNNISPSLNMKSMSKSINLIKNTSPDETGIDGDLINKEENAMKVNVSVDKAETDITETEEKSETADETEEKSETADETEEKSETKDETEEKSETTDETEEIRKTEEQPKLVQINETTYSTISEAIASANSGDTIKILEDLDLTEGIVIEKDKNVRIDLNGKTITSTSMKTIDNKGTLTISGKGIITNNFDLEGEIKDLNKIEDKDKIETITLENDVICNTGRLTIEKAIIRVNNEKGVGIINKENGIVNLGNMYDELDNSLPRIEAIVKGSRALINNGNGEINFYDGSIFSTKSIKNMITRVLSNYSFYEELQSDIIKATLKLVEADKILKEDEEVLVDETKNEETKTEETTVEEKKTEIVEPKTENTTNSTDEIENVGKTETDDKTENVEETKKTYKSETESTEETKQSDKTDFEQIETVKSELEEEE